MRYIIFFLLVIAGCSKSDDQTNSVFTNHNTVVESEKPPVKSTVSQLSDTSVQKVSPPTRATETDVFLEAKTATNDFVNEFENYSLEEITKILPLILRDTDKQKKERYFKIVAGFRNKLQSDFVSSLIAAFERETDSEIRDAILNAINLSGDPRFADVCISAKDDESPNIRVMAGALLIERNNRDGVRVISESLNSLNDWGQNQALGALLDATHQFNLNIDLESILNDPDLTHREKVRKGVERWNEWWEKNKERVKQ